MGVYSSPSPLVVFCTLPEFCASGSSLPSCLPFLSQSGSGYRYYHCYQERFVDLYGNDAAARSRKGKERFNKWLWTGATVAGVVLLGSLLSRK
uniref:Uncharacterized protein n=1 Tax=Sphaerodactylus townsendi TaxID=933632 RepID=A0ACB8F7W1_9SAUR